MTGDNLVSTDWLEQHLSAPDVVAVDASWYLPTDNRDPHAEYLERHIPGAVYFDIDRIADTSSDLPHMLPRPEAFSSAMRKMGIGDGQRIVVYDGAGMYSAPRVWWTFRTMGVSDVAVLDGGLPRWIAEDRPLEDGPVHRPERHFTSRLDHGAVRDLDDVRRLLNTGAAQIVDARSAERFHGEAPEPRPGLRAGHMPGSLNLPFDTILEDGVMIGADALKAAFEGAGIDLTKPIVTTCGSGVTAALLALALAEIGHRKVSVYDGSWSEWGGRDDVPVEAG